MSDKLDLAAIEARVKYDDLVESLRNASNGHPATIP